MEDLTRYLQPGEFLDFNKKTVHDRVLEITKNLSSEKEKAIALFYWVRDEIKYNMASYYMLKSNFKASVTLRRRYGFCVSKAVLLSAFARAAGIPARIHLADIINHKIPQKVIDYLGMKIFYHHGYSELFINNKWIKATPAFDKQTSLRASYPLVNFDGKNDAILASLDENGKKFVEYIKDRGNFIKLPYNDIEKDINRLYKHVIERGFNTKPFKNKD